MPRAKARKIPVKNIAPGDTVRMKGNGPDSDVKAISLVLHLENGMDEVYEAEDEVSVVDAPVPGP